ncbi:MAG: hypothetical protein RR614_11030 [Eubacterium sp.]
MQGTLNFRIDRTNTVESTALFTLPDGTTEVLINGRVIALYLTLSLDGQGNLILVNAREIDGSQGAGTTGSQEAFLNPRTGLLSDRASVYGALLLLGILSIGMGWRFRKIK